MMKASAVVCSHALATELELGDALCCQMASSVTTMDSHHHHEWEEKRMSTSLGSGLGLWYGGCGELGSSTKRRGIILLYPLSNQREQRSQTPIPCCICHRRIPFDRLPFLFLPPHLHAFVSRSRVSLQYSLDSPYVATFEVSIQWGCLFIYLSLSPYISVPKPHHIPVPASHASTCLLSNGGTDEGVGREVALQIFERQQGQVEVPVGLGTLTAHSCILQSHAGSV